MKVTIDAVLEKKCKTRYWLAMQTGIRYQNLSNLCNNEITAISFDVLTKICEVLECKPNDIFDLKA